VCGAQAALARASDFFAPSDTAKQQPSDTQVLSPIAAGEPQTPPRAVRLWL
jgi:hypothetical protein